MSAVRMILVFAFLCSSSWAAASCMRDGQAQQSVSLSTEGMTDTRWYPVPGEMHRVTLPNGFQLGVLIEPATQEKYREWLVRSPAIDESVRIQLFDLSGAEPKALSNTWGGANSRQGFGPKGGANRVNAMGQQVTLWLHKPTCITRDQVASAK